MFEMVLIAHGSIPVYPASWGQKNDRSADFITMMSSFTEGSHKKKLATLRLGKLNYQIQKSGELLFVFCTKDSSETLPPSENQLKVLIDSILDHSFFSEINILVNSETGMIDEEKIPVDHIEKRLKAFEEAYRSNEDTLAETEPEQNHAINSWKEIPKNIQKGLLEILEPIITGDAVSVLNTDPLGTIVKQIALLFRIPNSIIEKTSLPNYNYGIDLLEQAVADSIAIDPKNGTINGSEYQKNKYLEKEVKEILKLPSQRLQLHSINLLVETVGTSVRAVLALGSKFNKRTQQITDILNDLGYERSHLVFQIIKKNFPIYYERIVELPIHEEWFSKW
ncbi:MAG: hypothetical protein ACFFD4_27745 [Candidatus Odinarchaeota archaeon]